MLSLARLLAQAVETPLPVPPIGDGSLSGWREAVYALIAAFVVGGALVFWAVYIRKRPRGLSGSGSRVLHESSDQDGEHSGRRRRRKRKDNHPDNFPRNPTLSETGGLPPVRPDDPSRPPD